MIQKATLKCLPVLIFILAFLQLKGQSVLYPKWEPSFRLQQGFGENWSAKLSLGGLYVLGGISDAEGVAKAHLDRLDARLFITRKLDRIKLAGGYMYRKYGPLDSLGYEHRFTEELSFSFPLGNQKMDNRLRLEQRIQDEGFTNRVRERVSTKFPFKGPKIDTGEAYLFVAEALVYSFSNEVSALENRVDVGIGWELSAAQVFQLTLEHRFKGPNEDQALHIITAYTYSF